MTFIKRRKTWNHLFLTGSLILFSIGLSAQSTSQMQPASSTKAKVFWLGADISGTTELESRGVVSYNKDNVQTENTLLMKQLMLNAVRLRVWVNPKDGWSSKEDVLVMAKRAKEHDMALMIDFHYSDWWADPEKQNIPAAWKDYDYETMKEALACHTQETLQLLKDHDIDVKWVQVGNETSDGFLWEVGRASTHMDQYAGLTTAGYDAVKRVYPDAEVIVHLDNAFDSDLYDFIFDGLKQHGGKWDVIGVSVYPYWAMKFNHQPNAEKTLEESIKNINRISKKYDCEVMIVETGVEAAKPVEGKEFMANLIEAAMNETEGRCTGVFYWAPEICRGGYALGAFQNDRPTIIMDAFTEAATQISNKD